MEPVAKSIVNTVEFETKHKEIVRKVLKESSNHTVLIGKVQKIDELTFDYSMDTLPFPTANLTYFIVMDLGLLDDVDVKYTFYTLHPQTEKFKLNFLVDDFDRIMPYRPLPSGFSVHVDNSEIDSTFVVKYNPSEDDVVRANLKGGVFKIRIRHGIDVITTINLELDFFDIRADASSGYDCGICSKEFNEQARIPKVLSCGHTVCAQCLKYMEKKSHPNEDRDDLPIPFVCPHDQLKIDIPAAEHKTNIVLLKLIRAKKEKEAEEKRRGPKAVDNPDVPCYESPDHESDVYCEACEETYCTFCFSKVHSIKKMSAHKSIPVEEKPQKISACPVHSEKRALNICVEASCTSAHKLFCYLCQRDKLHKGHQYKTLETLIEKNKQELQKIVDGQNLSTVIEKYNLVQMCLPTFGENSTPVNEVRAQIEKFHDQQKREDLHNFDEWVRDKRHRMKSVKNDLADDKKVLLEIHEEARKILKRKEKFYEVGDLLERSAKIVKIDDRLVDDFRPIHHFDFSKGMNHPPKLLEKYVRNRSSRGETTVENPEVDDD